MEEKAAQLSLAGGNPQYWSCFDTCYCRLNLISGWRRCQVFSSYAHTHQDDRSKCNRGSGSLHAHSQVGQNPHSLDV